MISRELLSEVLDVHCTYIEDVVGDIIRFETYGIHYQHEINIYKLTHLCKAWVCTLGYKITEEMWEISRNNFDYRITIHSGNDELFCTSSCFEHSAFFEACQRVLDNKELKNEEL